jgi:hypothetical protein
LFIAVKKTLDAYTNKRFFAVKKSVLKQIVHNNPPKKVMHIMGYKSVDSMLKSESVSEIIIGMRLVESTAWLNSFISEYDKLKPNDFEVRELELFALASERWQKDSKHFVENKRHNVTHIKEAAAIAVLPLDGDYKQGMALTLSALIIHYINEIRLYSSYFKLNQVKSDFGKVLKDAIVGDVKSVANIAGQNIHWRILQRYYGKLDDTSKHPEIFEPHIQPEDLHWRKAEEVLFEINSQLGWWSGLDYVGVMDMEVPVSFNLMDNAISLCNQTSYNRRNYYHFRESLWNELFIRYMGEQTLEKQVLKQLGMHLIVPESLKIPKKRKLIL